MMKCKLKNLQNIAKSFSIVVDIDLRFINAEQEAEIIGSIEHLADNIAKHMEIAKYSKETEVI